MKTQNFEIKNGKTDKKVVPKNVGNELLWILNIVSSKSRFIKFPCQWILVPMGLWIIGRFVNLPSSYVIPDVNFAYPEANNSNKKSALKVIKVMSWEHHYVIHIHSFYDKCIRDCKNLICSQSYGTVPFVADIVKLILNSL